MQKTESSVASLGSLFVISAPSGAGKSTLVGRILAMDTGLRISISHTTRPRRDGEVEARDYYFIDKPKFDHMLAQGDFLEWAKVHGNYYGTTRAWVQQQMAIGVDILLEIDWQGAKQVRALFPGMVGIFIMPPSLTELEKRLRGRAQDSEQVIQERISNAHDEIQHANAFDFVIINRTIEDALADLYAVVRSERLRPARQKKRYPEVFRILQ